MGSGSRYPLPSLLLLLALLLALNLCPPATAVTPLTATVRFNVSGCSTATPPKQIVYVASGSEGCVARQECAGEPETSYQTTVSCVLDTESGPFNAASFGGGVPYASVLRFLDTGCTTLQDITVSLGDGQCIANVGGTGGLMVVVAPAGQGADVIEFQTYAKADCTGEAKISRKNTGGNRGECQGGFQWYSNVPAQLLTAGTDTGSAAHETNSKNLTGTFGTDRFQNSAAKNMMVSLLQHFSLLALAWPSIILCTMW